MESKHTLVGSPTRVKPQRFVAECSCGETFRGNTDEIARRNYASHALREKVRVTRRASS